MVLIRDMGMTLGEILDLDELADDCEADGVWEFFADGPADQVHERRRVTDQPVGDQVAERFQGGRAMDFDIPADLAEYLVELDEFIEREIKPLEQENDNIRFFDHRREDARTDWDRGGLPNEEWEALLREARRRADAAGHYRYPFPKEYGGKEGTNLGMAMIREHFARKGLGLHNDLQNEHSIVGNNVGLLLMIEHGTEAQKAEWIDDLAEGRRGFAFGITEPQHGSDATHMETTAVRDGDEWVINGEKTWNTGIHKAQYDLIFARTSGEAGDGGGHHRLPGADVEPGVRDRGVPVDVQHADRPCPHPPHRRPRAGRRDLRR